MNATSNQSNPYAPPTAKVEDAVDAGESDQAGRGTRLGAVLLDGLVFAVAVYVPLFIGLGADLGRIAQNPGLIIESIPRLGVAGLVALCGLVAFAVANIVLVKRNGQTIGKKALGIKVVRADGSPASLGRIFWMRNIIGWVVSFIPIIGAIYGLVDLLFIFASSRQCLHDKIADTIVVNA
jgi:uncharacterized RDD family membrane protein YckC